MVLVLLTGIYLLLQGSGAELCPEGESMREFDIRNEKSHSVFDDLTMSEIQKVYDYLRALPEFNTTHGEARTIDSTYVYHIERLDPPKAEVLAYLDGTGAKPDRMAWVIMYRGDQTPAVIEEYSVGPLPEIAGHQKLTIAGRDSIDYLRRHLYSYPDTIAWDGVVKREVSKIEHILERVTGFSLNNCTNKCLSWLPGMPGSFTGTGRNIWVFMIRKLEGLYLHPVGLQFKINAHDNLNPDDWTTGYVWFRGQTFNNFEEMVDGYEDPRNFSPDPDRNYDDTKSLYSTLNHRGDPLPKERKRGPQAYMPDGRRYTLDGHHIDWQGWTFDFNIRSLVGLQVHDVQFRAERIAYELGLSEIGIIYSGASPSPMHTAYIDSPFYFGLESFELIPGVDCPDYATYFDFAHFFQDGPIVHRKSACIFEHNRGVPLRHHYQSDHAGGYHYAQGMPGNVLILRAIVTVHNYDYIMDYIFHQNGVLEVSVSLSGYILSSYYTGQPADDSRGFKVVPDGLGQIHNHWLQFKVDVDVGQTRNRFQTLDVKVERIVDPSDPKTSMYVQKFEKNVRQTEKDAIYSYNFDKPKQLIFLNNDAENAYGNKKGYRLIPMHLNKQPLPDDWALEKGLSFERNQMVVTRHKDEEKRGSSMYNQQNFGDPVVRFLDFIEDDESIVDEDLVAWLTMGNFHIPHSEDIPIVQTPSLSLTYFLQPYNFFDEDPSLASRDNIRVTPSEDGSAHFEYAGDSPSFDCEPRNLPRRSGAKAGTPLSGLLFFLLIANILLS